MHLNPQNTIEIFKINEILLLLKNYENILEIFLNNQNSSKISKMTNIAIKYQKMTKYSQNL